MRYGKVGLALALSLIVATQAQAAACQQSDLLQRVKALPAFIVIPSGKNPREVLTHILGCDLPPLDAPELANGKTTSPDALIGKTVSNTRGDSLGVVKGVLVGRESLTTNLPVAAVDPGKGAAMLAVPTGQMTAHGTNLVFSSPSNTPPSSMEQFLVANEGDAGASQMVPASMFGIFQRANPMAIFFDRVSIKVEFESHGRRGFCERHERRPHRAHGPVTTFGKG